MAARQVAQIAQEHGIGGPRLLRLVDQGIQLIDKGLRPGTLAAVAGRAAAGAELLIGEGVMGLFDGAADGTGSTAHVAALGGIPVVLVVDVRGQAASAAAVVHGFASYRNDVAIVGVIFGLQMGAWYSIGGALLFSGYILYDTSNILHRCRIDEPLPAAIELFVDIVMLFWFILSLLNRD